MVASSSTFAYPLIYHNDLGRNSGQTKLNAQDCTYKEENDVHDRQTKA